MDRLILTFRLTFAVPLLAMCGVVLLIAFKLDQSLPKVMLDWVVRGIFLILLVHLATAAVLARRLKQSVLVWVVGYLIILPLSALIAYARLDALAKEYQALRPKPFDRV